MSGSLTTITLRPSEIALAIRAMRPTKRALFIWGPPGIAKSAVSQTVATGLNVAFIDIRLSQIDPTDLRGIPYPVVENGVHGIKWSAPLVLPRDLDFTYTLKTEFHEPLVLNFENLNPTGVNGIRVIKQIDAVVSSVGGGKGVAKIIAQDETSVTAAVFVGDEMVPGAIRFTVSGKAEALIGCEEFNSGAPAVQAASYQFILDRRLGEYLVPEGCFTAAMGNRDTDKGVTFKMGPPIMNRFVHVEMRPDFTEWLDWALDARVHPEVVGYISAFKENLFQFTPSTAARGFPTPRSWHAVSDIISEPENAYLPEQVELALIVGAVGEGQGGQFHAFRKIAAELPKADLILSGELKTLKEPPEVHLAYALTTTLCYELKERAENIARKHGANWNKNDDRTRWLKEADNFLEFLMVNFTGKDGRAGVEICVLGARGAIRVQKLPMDAKRMKMLDIFANRFKHLIAG